MERFQRVIWGIIIALLFIGASVVDFNQMECYEEKLYLGDSYSDLYHLDGMHGYYSCYISASYAYEENLYSTESDFEEGYLLSTPINVESFSALEALRDNNRGLVDFHDFIIDEREDADSYILNIHGFYIGDCLYYYINSIKYTESYYKAECEIQDYGVLIKYAPDFKWYFEIFLVKLFLLEVIFLLVFKKNNKA